VEKKYADYYDEKQLQQDQNQQSTEKSQRINRPAKHDTAPIITPALKFSDNKRAKAESERMLTKLTNSQNLPQLDNYSGFEGVDVLVGLGLSSRQSRVYLALIITGPCGARVIARLAGVPRQEVYGLLLELQQSGLVRQNLTVPISYTPIPLIDALKLLLEQKTNDLNVVTQKAKTLADKLKPTSPAGTINLPAKPSFGMVSQGERGKKYQLAIEQTQCSIEALISWVRFKQWCFYFERQLIDALKKEVTIKIIAEKPLNNRLPKWVHSAQQKYSNFILKTLPTVPEAVVTIFDHSQIALAYNPSSRFTKGPDLWSSHPAFLVSYQTYFNTIWVKTEN
jgi:sugar-specific transcriptional regulator TrmB